MNAADTLLGHLDAVRETGPGRWLARCPAHDDKSPSLSVRECDDGVVLLHDFGGCDSADVLAALGLELKDLFPAPLTHHRPPTRSGISASDALQAIDNEALTVAIIAADLRAHREIDNPTWNRLALAAQRIGAARDACAPARAAR
jgi:hypothetical protein